jgi:peptidoglycan/LPS O-acetylase OafA/YrhL
VLVRCERVWVFWVAVAGPLCLGAMGYSAYFATQVGYMDGLYNTLVYSKPYARLVPFVVGIATGGLLAASPQHGSHSVLLTAAGHTLAALGLAYCAVAHLYLVVDTTLAGSFAALASWSVSYSVLYAPVWSAVLAWLSYSCYHRLFPSLVQSVMEWQLWSVLARLGFGIYLFHPIVLHLREYNRVQLPTLTVVWILDNFLAVFVCSVGLAFLFYVTVEYPASAVVKRLLPSPKKE